MYNVSISGKRRLLANFKDYRKVFEQKSKAQTE